MTAPEVDVTLSTGEAVPLKSLFEKQRLALVFLRHLGCVFCKEHVAQLRSLGDMNIVFVTLGTVEQTEAFRLRMKSPHRFISDPDKKLHALFELKQGSLAQLLNSHVMVRAISALLKGFMNGLPIGDSTMLPGVFLIEPDGSVSWEQRGRDASDTPSAQVIQVKLQGSTS